MYSKNDTKIFTKSMSIVNAKFIKEIWVDKFNIIGSFCPNCNATNFHDSWIDKNGQYQCPVCTYKVKKVSE